jgi:hypothetical protein
VLLVAARTPSLDADVKALGFAWKDLCDGYWELAGGPFVLYVAEVDVVAEAEGDDVLRSFGHAAIHTVVARRWLSQQAGGKEIVMQIQELEGYDEVLQKLIDSAPLEQRLAGLAPELVLAAYRPEQVVLALPDEVLRGLSDEYLATLSEATRAAVRARIGQR